MKLARYQNKYGKEINLQYEETQPCIMCGEPVLSASMGGINLCPWCDMGKCRYCGINVFVLKEEIDGGISKRNFREHIKWHKDNTCGTRQRRT